MTHQAPARVFWRLPLPSSPVIFAVSPCMPDGDRHLSLWLWVRLPVASDAPDNRSFYLATDTIHVFASWTWEDVVASLLVQVRGCKELLDGEPVDGMDEDQVAAWLDRTRSTTERLPWWCREQVKPLRDLLEACETRLRWPAGHLRLIPQDRTPKGRYRLMQDLHLWVIEQLRRAWNTAEIGLFQQSHSRCGTFRFVRQQFWMKLLPDIPDDTFVADGAMEQRLRRFSRKVKPHQDELLMAEVLAKILLPNGLPHRGTE